MTENNENKPSMEAKNEKVTQIRVVRHKWDDEILKEKKRRNRNVIIILSIVVAFGIGIIFGRQIGDIGGSPTSISKIDLLKQILSNEWYFGKDIDKLDDELNNKALKGMTTFDVDPHTEYLTPEETAQWAGSLSDGFVGIGVQFYLMDEQPIIRRVFKDSPAERAGVQSGDIILAVDGTIVTGMSTEDIASLVKGEADTVVTITFIRQGKEIKLDITRGTVSTSAFGQMVEDNIGYLEITQFGEATHLEVERYLKMLKAEGATNLILDLRDNGGGYLATVEKIGSFFLDEGTEILHRESKDGTTTVSTASNGDKYKFDEIIVLTNENTASASEVLAAALQQQIQAKTLGVNTYGKGTVQITRQFSDGSSIKYTVEEWITPNGTKLNKVGIAPDIEVKLHDILHQELLGLPEGVTYQIDQVSPEIKVIQLSLDFLGFKMQRLDGYFDNNTQQIVKQVQQQYQLPATGIIDKATYDLIITQVVREWNINRPKYDNQLKKAIEVIHE